MSINKETIRYTANLARLNLSADEEELFSEQLSDILRYINKLNELDTTYIEPMSHAVSIGNVFREDVIRDSLSNEQALKNSPEKQCPFFKVPKVID